MTLVEQLTYCQVVFPITFQDNNMTLSPTASSVRGAGPSTPASVSAAQVTTELTKTATAAPKSATPTALEVNHFSLNPTLNTGLEVQKVTFNTDSDIKLSSSFGTNDDNSTYLESAENLPEIKYKNLDLFALIKETKNIHEVVQEDI